MLGEPGRIDKLRGAVETFNRAPVEHICAKLIDSLNEGGASLSERDGLDVLRMLRRMRHFAFLQKVADAMIWPPRHSPPITCGLGGLRIY
jgi:hypothetical protein